MDLKIKFDMYDLENDIKFVIIMIRLGWKILWLN